MDCVHVPNLGDQHMLKSTHTGIANKMDFNIFVKSFELIAKKLYPDRNLDEAFIIFFDIVPFLIK